MRVQPKFFRKGNTIREFHSNNNFSDTDFHCKKTGNPSKNEAKRKSREIQLKNGGIACGILKVVDKLPSQCNHYPND